MASSSPECGVGGFGFGLGVSVWLQADSDDSGDVFDFKKAALRADENGSEHAWLANKEVLAGGLEVGETGGVWFRTGLPSGSASQESGSDEGFSVGHWGFSGSFGNAGELACCQWTHPKSGPT